MKDDKLFNSYMTLMSRYGSGSIYISKELFQIAIPQLKESNKFKVPEKMVTIHTVINHISVWYYYDAGEYNFLLSKGNRKKLMELTEFYVEEVPIY